MFKKDEIKGAFPLLIALAALIIAVPLRIYQYAKIIDPQTGFFNEINISVYIFYIVLGVASAAGIIIPFIRHNSMKLVPVSSKSVGFTVVSLFFAVTLIIDSASQLMDYFELYSVDLTYTTQTLKEYITAQGGNILLIQAILGGLSAVYFFVTGVTIGLGNSDSSKYKLLALAPSLWCIFKLLYRFKRTISFVNVSDLLLELFLAVFSLMFLFTLAYYNSKIDSYDENSTFKNIFWKIYGYGVPTAVIALAVFLPRFIVVITGNSAYLNEHYGVNYSDFALAIFAVYTCISTIKAENKTNIE